MYGWKKHHRSDRNSDDKDVQLREFAAIRAALLASFDLHELNRPESE
jgi:hypothetical protein